MPHNYFHLVPFVWNICPEVIRDVFLILAKKDRNIQFTDLGTYLQYRKKDTMELKTEILKRYQYKRMFPRSGKTDINRWDIDLLCTAVLALFGRVLSFENEKCIREIRETRNKLLYLNPKDKITDEVFSEYWKCLEEATLTLAKNFFSAKCCEEIRRRISDTKEDIDKVSDTLRVWLEDVFPPLQEESGNDTENFEYKMEERQGETNYRKYEMGGAIAEGISREDEIDEALSLRVLSPFISMREAIDPRLQKKEGHLKDSEIQLSDSVPVYNELSDKNSVVEYGNDSIRIINSTGKAIVFMMNNPPRYTELRVPGIWRFVDFTGVHCDMVFDKKEGRDLTDLLCLKVRREDEGTLPDLNFTSKGRGWAKFDEECDHEFPLEVPIPAYDSSIIERESDSTKNLWKNVRSVKDAQKLIHCEPLPNKRILSEMVKRLGRKSDIIVLICESICKEIEAASSNIEHVFAAYTPGNEERLHFVVLLEKEFRSIRISELNTKYEILFRCCKRVMHSVPPNVYSDLEIELSPEESMSLKKTVCKITEAYMENYKYLSAITARKIKSEHGENLCIILYVHPCTEKYSIIPHTEEPLPSKITGYEVIVRNGVFKTAEKAAHEYHENLRMGCTITSNLVNSFGTLGGFIDHPEYGLCGFTCAHVVFDTARLRNLKKEKRQKLSSSHLEGPCLVFQPVISLEAIGRVVEAFYEEGNKETAGLDLALFLIESRPPVSGDTPRCTSNGELNYVTGKTWGRTRISPGVCEVQKFGCVTGITTGKVMFDGMSVRQRTFVSKSILGEVDSILYNQYEIANDNLNICERGDSGSLVFMKDFMDELVCVGMVNGVLDKDMPLHGVVTPITEILRALGVQSLKSFRKELTTDVLEKMLLENEKQLQSDIRSQLQNEFSSMRSSLSDVAYTLQNSMFTFQREVQSSLLKMSTCLQNQHSDNAKKACCNSSDDNSMLVE